eukprot:9485821-Pyramimonas_sp.AAC.1
MDYDAYTRVTTLIEKLTNDVHDGEHLDPQKLGELKKTVRKSDTVLMRAFEVLMERLKLRQSQ